MKQTMSKKYDPRQIRRETTRRLLWAGLASLVMAALAFVAVFAFFPRTAFLPQQAGQGETARPVNWEMLDGVTGVITLSLLAGGLVFALVEYFPNEIQQRREAALASFEIYKQVFDRLMQPEAVAARRWVLQHVPLPSGTEDEQAWLARCQKILDTIPRGWKGERPPGRESLKNVLNTFDFIGFVAEHYWDMENELVEWFSPSIAKVWERVAPVVESEAELRSEPDFYRSARDFGTHCVAWRKAHYPQSNIIQDAT
jgi:hypothetical protein